MSSSSSSLVLGHFGLLGGYYISPSLVLDIVNGEELKGITFQRFTGVPPEYLRGINPSRWRADLSKQDAIWGFHSNSQSRISNAVVLTGDSLVLKINPLGHAVGTLYPTNRLVFSRSTLTVTMEDVVYNHSRKVVFTNFSSPQDDVSRFISWEIPKESAASEAFFASYGVHGIYVIKVSESLECFWRADWTDPVDANLAPKPSESYLHVMALSWNQILREMYGNIVPTRNVSFSKDANFLTALPLTADTPEVIFTSKSKYENFLHPLGVGYLDLTDEEKEVVIRDSALGVASSQLPILTSDAPWAPVLGIGMKTTAATPSVFPPPIVRNSSPITIPNRDSRKFSLIGQSAQINSIQDLNNIVVSHGISTQTVADPVRVFTNSSLGGRVSFLASGNEVIGATSPTVTLTEGRQFILEEDVPVISFVGIDIDLDSMKATVSFEVADGNPLIDSVSYGLGFDENPYVTYVDNNGLTRSFIYDLDSRFPFSSSSVFYAQVGIADQQGRTRFYYAVYPLGLLENRPAVFNLRAYPRHDGSNMLDVYYDIQDSREHSFFEVSLSRITSRKAGDLGLVSSGTGKYVVVMAGSPPTHSSSSLFGEDYVEPKITASSLLAGIASGDRQTGPVMLPIVHPSPLVTLAPAGQRFGIYDGEDIKNTDIKVNTQYWVQSTSSSFSSESSLGFSESSRSSLGFSESSQSMSSQSSQSMSSHSSCSSFSSVSESSSSTEHRGWHVKNGDPHGWYTGIGQTYQNTPFNYDDNALSAPGTNLLWFSSKVDGLVDYIVYTSAAWPSRPGGAVISNASISHHGVVQNFSGEFNLVSIELDLMYVQIYGVRGGLSLSVRRKGSWNSSGIQNIGGAYYYVWKGIAPTVGEGVINHTSAPGVDGISTVATLPRSTFVIAGTAPTTPELNSTWEIPIPHVMHGIQAKDYELYPLIGTANASWDNLVVPDPVASGCFPCTGTPNYKEQYALTISGVPYSNCCNSLNGSRTIIRGITDSSWPTMYPCRWWWYQTPDRPEWAINLLWTGSYWQLGGGTCVPEGAHCSCFISVIFNGGSNPCDPRGVYTCIGASGGADCGLTTPELLSLTAVVS